MNKSVKLQLLIVLILGGTHFYGFCQQIDTLQYHDYVIKYSKINFHMNDTVFPYTMFVEPDGRFYFREGEVKHPHSDGPHHRYIIEGKNNVAPVPYKEVYTTRADSIVEVKSLFPLLISHDSAFINRYPFDFESIKLIYELQYSFILENLLEPSLFFSEEKKTIRIVFRKEDMKNPGKYFSIRVDFKEGNNTLTYSVIDFDSNANFNLLKRESCMVAEKKMTKFEEAIGRIDFNKENNFIVADGNEKFLIEYRIGNKYYVLSRTLDYSAERNQFMNLFKALYTLAQTSDCAHEK
jgi:hypothetical protein